MSGMYDDDAKMVKTMIREAQHHAAIAEDARSEARAKLNAELAQAKALIALAILIQGWSQDGVPTLVLK